MSDIQSGSSYFTDLNGNSSNSFRPVADLPEQYRQLFLPRFQQFNQIQSSLVDYILESDKSLVICSPTGSGKTVLLELAIVRELIKFNNQSSNFNEKNVFKHKSHVPFHALYLAPLKAIVEEKCSEWQTKFAPYGLKCFALTGDTELDDYVELRESNYSDINIFLATPEKFDFMIRTDPDSRQLLRILQLVMIDEIHMLGDRQRGDILEATITRIKAIRDNANNIVKIINASEDNSFYQSNSEKSNLNALKPLRFIAISATAPNVEDISAWLDIRNGLGICVSQDLRPVQLNKIVLGFEPIKSSCSSEYRFDIQLSYKLENVIRTHSACKPTLIFCSTRKSVEFTAKTLASSHLTYFESHNQRTRLFYELSKMTLTNMDMFEKKSEITFKNIELKQTLASGVAFYHSGLEYSDRKLLEQLFSLSLIPVLVSTSSLAMGVNLPAHLVIIKNTVQYNAGSTVEYDVSQVLQMIGRAGRPQFDSSATAIILTKSEKKSHYESILNSQKIVESNLFRTLAEQLTVEIVLRTVTDINLAIDWICSTFMFIRIVKNPAYYGSDIPCGDFNGAYPFILEWCQRTLARLQKLGLIFLMKNNSLIEPTHLARIFTRYSLSLATTEKLIEFVRTKFSIEELLTQLCNCREIYQDVILRVNEKRFLNELNKQIRYKFKSRFKTNVMKINCLIQALFESVNIETCLIQDCNKLVRSGQRLSKCLLEVFYYLFNLNHEELSNLLSGLSSVDMHLETFVSAVRLAKAFRAKIWHDSNFVVKQLPKIGNIFSHSLVERGYTSFDKLLDANPREIEFCLKRNPPFGSYLIEEVKSLPRYRILLRTNSLNYTLENEKLKDSIQSTVYVQLECWLQKSDTDSISKPLLKPENHYLMVIVGCKECDQIILLNRFTDKMLYGSNGLFKKQIALVHTTLEQAAPDSANITDSDLVSQSNTTTNSKRKLDNSSTANNSVKKVAKKSKTKNTDTDDAASLHIVHTEAYKNFVKELKEQENNIGEIAFHCSYRDQKCHTIQAMIISESFVGLDVETQTMIEFDIAMSRQVDLNKSTTKNAKNINTNIQTPVLKNRLGANNNKTVSKAELAEEIEDDDLFELLDDYNDNFFKDKDDNGEDTEKGCNGDSDSSQNDLSISSQSVCYSQYGNREYLQSSQPLCEQHSLTSGLDMKPATTEFNRSTCETSIVANFSKPVQTNLFEKLAKYRAQMKQMNATLEDKREYMQSILGEDVDLSQDCAADNGNKGDHVSNSATSSANTIFAHDRLSFLSSARNMNTTAASGLSSKEVVSKYFSNNSNSSR